MRTLQSTSNSILNLVNVISLAAEKGSDCLTVDIETIVLKNFGSLFKSITIRAVSLKRSCKTIWYKQLNFVHSHSDQMYATRYCFQVDDQSLGANRNSFSVAQTSTTNLTRFYANSLEYVNCFPVVYL